MLSLLSLQITDVPIVPPLVLFLAKHPLVDKFDLSSMVRVSSGAAPLGKELEIAMLKRLPKVQRLQQGTWSSKKLSWCNNDYCMNNNLIVFTIIFDYCMNNKQGWHSWVMRARCACLRTVFGLPLILDNKQTGLSQQLRLNSVMFVWTWKKLVKITFFSIHTKTVFSLIF